MKIKELDIILFFRQFAVLISAGVPIIRSCDVLIQSQLNTHMRLLLRQLKSHLLSGKKLYDFLTLHPQQFHTLHCRLIHISEHTGRLDTMLMTVANHLENQRLFKNQIHRALFYPCIIACMGLLTMLSMLIFIVPRFAELCQGSEETLPMISIWIFSLSKILNQHIATLLILITILTVILFRYQSINRIKHYLKYHASKFPFIKTCLMQITFARFARNLGLTLAAGINISDALQLSAAATHSTHLSTLAESLSSKINSGLSLHCAMGNAFPPLMKQLVEVGEESGKLPYMLDKIADFYESDASHLLTRLSQLLEPLIMLLLGVVIGGMVICIYLPIFNLGNTF